MKETPALKVVYRQVADLIPYARNARTHSDEQVTRIANDMKAHGYRDFRFLLSNDNYVCTKDGAFFRVCRVQSSKSGRLIRKYETTKLKGSIDKYGYITYRILTEKGKKHLKAHREMLLAWEGKSTLPQVNHKDGNKQNNSLSNLEWCSAKDNVIHAVKTGLLDPRKSGAKYSKVPLVDYLTIYCLWKHKGLSKTALAKMNKCSRGAIDTVLSRTANLLSILENRNGQPNYV